MTEESLITTERRGHVLVVGLNRPAKRNAFTVEMLRSLGRAYEELETDSDLRAGVVFAHGEHFTGGLDFAEVAPVIVNEGLVWNEGERDPWRNDGKPWTKPVIVAAQGRCMTLAIELLLAADIRIAASDARFTQLEVQRGIYPFGGATIRFPREAGWGNAMRWILTGEEFDAAEALRLGIVQEVVEPGQQLDRALELAEAIAERSAPAGRAHRAALRAAGDPRGRGRRAGAARRRRGRAAEVRGRDRGRDVVRGEAPGALPGALAARYASTSSASVSGLTPSYCIAAAASSVSSAAISASRSGTSTTSATWLRFCGSTKVLMFVMPSGAKNS